MGLYESLLKRITAAQDKKNVERFKREFEKLETGYFSSVANYLENGHEVTESAREYAKGHLAGLAVRNMAGLTCGLPHSEIPAAVEKVKNFCLKTSEQGILEAGVVAGLLQIMNYRVSPVAERKPLYDYLANFCIEQHEAGKIDLDTAIKTLAEALIFAQLPKKQKQDLLLNVMLPWVTAKAETMADSQDVKMAKNIQALFQASLHDKGYFTFDDVEPAILEEDIDNDALYVCAHTSSSDYIRDCCVIFKKAADDRGNPLVACSHGVLRASEMIELAKLHPDMRGNETGQRHIDLLSHFTPA